MPRNEKTTEPDEIGKAHPGERARDEQREDRGPGYGGEAWEVADERGDRRFGNARNDDADPSELSKGQGSVDDDEWPGSDAIGGKVEANAEEADTTRVASDANESDGGGEAGGQRAGFGRGEKPHKPLARSKKNPQSGAKRKTDR